MGMCEVNLGLADRFNDNNSSMATEIRPVKSVKIQQEVQKPKIQLLRDELFEKIVAIPCWFEYDQKTQYDLIIKFLA